MGRGVVVVVVVALAHLGRELAFSLTTQLQGLIFTQLYITVGEGNGNPFEYSWLENPRDGRAWWTAFCGVSQIQTQWK